MSHWALGYRSGLVSFGDGRACDDLLPRDSIEKAMDCLGKQDDCHQMGYLVLIKNPGRTSLVVQWIRLCLPMQGILVRPLAPERSHMLWINEDHAPQLLRPCSPAYKLQLLSLCAATPEAHMPRAPAPPQERPLQ